MTSHIDRAEAAGEAVGRAYARTTAALVAPIRNAPAPRWPRERVLARSLAAQRRVKNAPRRTLSGLRALLTRKRPDGTPLLKKPKKQRSANTRLGQIAGTAFLAWWGWAWAAAPNAIEGSISD